MTTKEKVMRVLKEIPETRDNDLLLIMAIHENELRVPIRDISAYHYYGRLLAGELSGFESIRRMRQKLQEQHPELRATDEVRKRRKELERQMRIEMSN